MRGQCIGLGGYEGDLAPRKRVYRVSELRSLSSDFSLTSSAKISDLPTSSCSLKTRRHDVIFDIENPGGNWGRKT